MLNNKGAMFGLDARIALAIFGALSVISGAALYSAIQESKVISLITQIKEYRNALESYLVDTGIDLPNSVSDPINATKHTQDLINGTINASGWKGPYITATNNGSDFISFPGYNWLTFDFVPDVSFKFSPNIGNCAAAGNSGKNCFYWAVVLEVPEDICKAIDIKIDGNNDASNGNIRYALNSDASSITTGYCLLYVKSIPTLTKY